MVKQTRREGRQEPKKGPTEKSGNKGKLETWRDEKERHNGRGKRVLEGRKPEGRKATKKHLMAE